MLRLPSPTATTGKVDVTSFENKIGYSWQAVKDLQRVFACLSMADGKDVDEEYGMLVSTSEFSPKVTVPMSAQSLWRTVRHGFSLIQNLSWHSSILSPWYITPWPWPINRR